MRETWAEFWKGPLARLWGAAGAVLTVIALVAAFGGKGWLWVFLGSLVLVALTFWRFHTMRQQRDVAVDNLTTEEAKPRGGIHDIEIGENTFVGGGSISMHTHAPSDSAAPSLPPGAQRAVDDALDELSPPEDPDRPSI